MIKIDKRKIYISRLLVIVGVLLFICGMDWGILLIAPAAFIRKDWQDKELNKTFIKENKTIAYVIVGYMVIASLILLVFSLVQSIQHSIHNTANYRNLSIAYFIPAFLYLFVYDHWLHKRADQ